MKSNAKTKQCKSVLLPLISESVLRCCAFLTLLREKALRMFHQSFISKMFKPTVTEQKFEDQYMVSFKAIRQGFCFRTRHLE